MKLFYRAAFSAALLFLILRVLQAQGRVLLLIRLAHAEDASDLGEVRINAPTPDFSADKPSAFVSVIDPKPFLNQVKTLPELLSQQPGVHVQQFGGLGQFSTVSIRGSTAEQVSVLVDGMRINTAQGGAVDFSTLPLEAIDRIEVIRGGASARFGSDAVGGVVNIITRKVRKKQAIEASVGGGSFGTFKTSEGYSRKMGNGSFLVGHTHLQSEGDFPFQSTPTTIGGVQIGGGRDFIRENNAFFSENGLLKLEGSTSENLNLRLTSDWFGSKRQVPPTEEEAILLAPANQPEAKEELLKNYSVFRAEMKNVFVKGLTLQVQPYYRLDFSRFRDPSPALGGPIDVKTFNHAVGGRVTWDYLLPKATLSQRFQLFYEARGDFFEDENFVVPTQVSGLHRRLTQSVVLLDEISLWKDRLFLDPTFRFENTNDFGSRVALHGGVVVKPLSWLKAKANIENSFRYPNFNELFLPNEGIIRGNPNLVPEKAINFDAGLSFEHPYGRTEISYFLNRIDNSILFVPISAFTIAPVNTRRVNAQGLEFSTFLSPWRHLEVEGNYTFLNARFENSGKQLPGRPRHMANLKVTLKNRWGSIYALLQYVDDLPIDFHNTTFIKRQAQVDLGLSFKVKKYYYFAADFKNVTNIQPLDARGFPLPRFSALGSFGVRI